MTRVPGSSAASISEAARQSSPSTSTRPLPVAGSMRSDTIPTRPASASTFVLISVPRGCRYRSRNGRIPTSDRSVPAAKVSAGTTAPGTTSETTPAARQPTATDSSQKPGASISATNNSREATSQTCHSCTAWPSGAPGLDGLNLPPQPSARSPYPTHSMALKHVPPGVRSAVSTPRRRRFLMRALWIAALLPWPSASPAHAAQQPERRTLAGGHVAIYNLAGVVRLERGTGSDVVVELTRGGPDAGKLQIATGPLRGRETLRVIYPNDEIVYRELGRGANTTLRVRDDGTRSEERRVGKECRSRWSPYH